MYVATFEYRGIKPEEIMFHKEMDNVKIINYSKEKVSPISINFSEKFKFEYM